MKQTHWILGAVLVIALLTAPGASAQTTINVTNDAEWQAAAPASGDRVVFAAGTFNLSAQKAVVDNVTYIGAGKGVTILDGGRVEAGGITTAGVRAFTAWGDRGFRDGDGGNTVTAWDSNNTGQKGWVIQDMTIQNCVADGTNRDFTAGPDANNPLVGAVITDADMADDGGAIYMHNQAQGEFINVSFENNWTPDNRDSSEVAGSSTDGDDGGAVMVDGGARAVFRNCDFIDNVACTRSAASTNGADGDAGAIKMQGGNGDAPGSISTGTTPRNALLQWTTVECYDCTFVNNEAEDDAGAVQIAAEGGFFKAERCYFKGNSAEDDGQVYQAGNRESFGAHFINCVFENNVTTSTDAGNADRLFMVRVNTRFINNTFINNTTPDQGIIWNNAQTVQETEAGGRVDQGAIHEVILTNNIFVNNGVVPAQGVLDGQNPSGNNLGTFTMANNLFFGQVDRADGTTPAPIHGAGGVWTDPGTTGDSTNIDADPNLDANWVPQTGSAAIDAGATAGAPSDDFAGATRDANPDIGALEGGGAPPGEGEGEGEGEPQGNRILSNVNPPFIDEGATVILTGPEGTNHQWKLDGAPITGATNRTLIFDPVAQSDAGTYTVSYDGGTEPLSDSFVLSVNSEGTVPVSGLAGLIALAGACGLGGARLIRRRRN